MKALYYLSQSIGKKRKDGSPFYVMNILGIDRYGILNGVPVYFPDLSTYNDVLDMNIKPGTAVILDFSGFGNFTGGVTIDSRYAPLDLDKPSK